MALRRLLAPLDGSHLAEAVLPAIEALASRCRSSVILMHIREEHAPVSIHGERYLRDPDEAVRYLEAVANRLREKGLDVAYHVHETLEGDVARSIVQHADEFAPDLVVLCSHGSGGMRDWLYGSIAQQVVRLGTWPVLLLEPEADGSAPHFEPKRILVPIDYSELHQSPHRLAVDMAQAFSAQVMLLLVVPTLETLAGEAVAYRRMLPATMAAILQLAEDSAAERLRNVQSECTGEGVDVVAQVTRGETVAEIVENAHSYGAELIVLSTHGRAGVLAILEGSVAARVARRAGVPLLLVPTRRSP